MSCFTDCPYKQALDWLEDKHTLHKSVEITYVVDGYIVEMIDSKGVQDKFHGTTLLEAINKAAEKYPYGKARSKHEH